MENRFDYIQEVKKFNPYHGKDGRFTSKNGGGSAGAATGGTANLSNAEYKKYAQSVFRENDKLEAQYVKLGEDYDKAYDAVKECRRNRDAKGEAKAQKKLDALENKLVDFEAKIWESRGKRGQVEAEAYERGVVLA